MTREDMPLPPQGLLLSRDLIFTAKVTSTARALGCQVRTVGSVPLVLQLLEQGPPKVVFVDLAAGDLVAPPALLAYRQIAPGIPFIAFGSHVDTDALAQAAAAGCEAVMPRSKFTNALPDLIRRYLGAEDSPAD